jgi:uncharacterized membrane protein SirB2
VPLASALGLAWVVGFRPLEVPWLETRPVGLVLYIVAGSVALKRGRTADVRDTAFAVAPLAFAHVVPVAPAKLPQARLAGGMA